MSVLEFWRTHSAELAGLLWQHLVLVAISTGAAIVAGIPIGVLAARHPRASAPLVWLVNVAQTIPSLAMFGFLLPLPFIGGLGGRVAVTVLTLYALLPIIRTTLAGMRSIDPALIEAATSLGMTPGQRLAARRAAARAAVDCRGNSCRVRHWGGHRDDSRGRRCRRARRVHFPRPFNAGADRRPCGRDSGRPPGADVRRRADALGAVR